MPEPMYRQIAQDLRGQIEAGSPAPGCQLPSEPELRERYAASRNTIRDAIKWLVGRGLVETRPGSGTFVVERGTAFVTTLSPHPGKGPGGEGRAALAEAAARRRRQSDSMPRVGVLHAAGNVAGRLRVPEGTQIVSRYQERFIDSAPWSSQTSFYPMELVRRGAGRLIEAGDIPEGTISYLRDCLGLVQVGYRDRILVRPPRGDEARFFRLPDDGRIGVLAQMRTGFTAGPDGPVPFRMTVSAFSADRNQFVINCGEVPEHLADPVTWD